jgi:REP element-mobilizing transposase RayT
MARPLRTDFAGALHHVTFRGNERRPIFHDDRDRETFLGFPGETVQRFGWSVTTYVLMTNHFHLVVQTPEAKLSRGTAEITASIFGLPIAPSCVQGARVNIRACGIRRRR